MGVKLIISTMDYRSEIRTTRLLLGIFYDIPRDLDQDTVGDTLTSYSDP